MTLTVFTKMEIIEDKILFLGYIKNIIKNSR